MALERLQLLIEASSKDAVRGIKDVSDASGEASLKQRFLSQDSNLARNALDQLGLSSVSTGTALKGAALAGGGLAAVGLAKFALDGATEFVNLAGTVRDFQRATGAGAEDSSRWVAAVDDMGVSADSAEKAAFKLSKEIGNGSTKIGEFGVEIAKNKDGTLNLSETLLNVADAYTHTSDQGEKTALVTAAFGKAGKDLIPILEQGREGIKRLFEGAESGHQIFSQEDLQRAREFELAMDDLQDNMRGFKIEVGKAVVPALTEIASAGASTLTSVDNLAAGFGGVGNVVSKLNNFSPLTNAMHGLSVGAELLQGHFGAAAGEFARSLPVIGGVVGLFDDGAEAANKFAEKQQDLQDAQAKVMSLAAEGKTNTKEYTQAQRELEAISGEVAGAQKKVAESFQSVAGKALEATQGVLGLAGAQLAASGSIRAVDAAVDSYEDKQRAANEAAFAAAVAAQAAANAGGANEAANRASADAAEVNSDAQRDLAGGHDTVIASVKSAVEAAGAYAEQQLGPGVSGPKAAAAANAAMKGTLEELEAKYPALRGELELYFGKLNETPAEKTTRLELAGYDEAIAKALYLNELLDEATRARVAYISVVANNPDLLYTLIAP